MATTKQKNVIDTPIDRRETFMSLSKSINDSDAGMEHKLHTLYMIQQKDSKIDEIHMLLGELPDEIRDLEDEIEGLKTRLGKIREEMVDAEKFVAQKKIEAENSKAAIAKYQEQQANVKNNREYVSISREVEYQQLELELANKRIGEKNARIDRRAQGLHRCQDPCRIREGEGQCPQRSGGGYRQEGCLRRMLQQDPAPEAARHRPEQEDYRLRVLRPYPGKSRLRGR